MIDKTALKTLGWTEELVDAVEEVARALPSPVSSQVDTALSFSVPPSVVTTNALVLPGAQLPASGEPQKR